MFVVCAEKNKLTTQKLEPVTSGSINIYTVHFTFSADWEGLEKVAVFRAGNCSVSVLLPETGECGIPWEVLTSARTQLYAGVYGHQGDNIVLPTQWACLGTILEGTAVSGALPNPPTPSIWQQELARKGDRLGYTKDGALGLYSGGNLLSSVAVKGGEGGTGGSGWGVGHGLKIVDGDLTVDSVDDFEGDNTLPMTAAGVLTTVGNIEALLGTI